ncbi:MAG: hypothetical protein ACYCWK_06235 [Cuniculiplasma sp.]
MRIRKYWFFPKTIKYVNLDDFGLEPGITGLFDPNIPDISISPSNEMDLILYRNPSCPGCGSMDIVRNGTFIRTLETGIQIRVQRYLCNSCCYKFEARPPNYGYGKHFPHNMEEKSKKSRVKTSLRKTSELFHIIGGIGISHETIRRNIPEIPERRFESKGYFVYDEQYVHVDGVDKYRALLKDSKTDNFVEEILDDLKEDTLVNFFTEALSMFNTPEEIFITTDGYHYESVLSRVSRIIGKSINRQRCLFHIEKDLAHKIKEAGKEKELDGAKRLIKFMFFQNHKNLENLGKNKEAVVKLIQGKSEKEVVEIIMEKLTSLYGGDDIISHFLDFVKEHRKEVFLYLENREVEKTSDLAEQHFSVMSWLFKHRFKTKRGLLKTSYWYHHYLSTQM